MATAKEGYKDHRPGSNKGEVHRVFDDKGPEAAIKKAVALEIQESTARTWISSWRTDAPKKAAKKVAKKAPAKKTVKKTAKAKKPAAKKAPANKAPEAAEASA
jgi:hypothetical protein